MCAQRMNCSPTACMSTQIRASHQSSSFLFRSSCSHMFHPTTHYLASGTHPTGAFPHLPLQPAAYPAPPDLLWIPPGLLPPALPAAPQGHHPRSHPFSFLVVFICPCLFFSRSLWFMDLCRLPFLLVILFLLLAHLPAPIHRVPDPPVYCAHPLVARPASAASSLEGTDHNDATVG